MPESYKTQKDIPKTIIRRDEKYKLYEVISHIALTDSMREKLNARRKLYDGFCPIFKNIIIEDSKPPKEYFAVYRRMNKREL
jgi:hypothetical protein